MKMKNMKYLAVAVVSIVVLSIVTVAQGDSGYQVSWWVMGNGGDTSSGNNFAISGTIGQPVVSTASGSDYVVHGGFWQTLTTSVPTSISLNENGAVSQMHVLRWLALLVGVGVVVSLVVLWREHRTE